MRGSLAPFLRTDTDSLVRRVWILGLSIWERFKRPAWPLAEQSIFGYSKGPASARPFLFIQLNHNLSYSLLYGFGVFLQPRQLVLL